MKRKFSLLALVGVLSFSFSSGVFANEIDSTQAATRQAAATEADAIKTLPTKSFNLNQDSLYLKGIADATIHHKRFGRNFLAGLFGVQWGCIVVALVNPKSPDPQVVGQDNCNNPSYQKGYRKKAKEKNVLNALAGLALPLSLFLLLSSAGDGGIM